MAVLRPSTEVEDCTPQSIESASAGDVQPYAVLCGSMTNQVRPSSQRRIRLCVHPECRPRLRCCLHCGGTGCLEHVVSARCCSSQKRGTALDETKYQVKRRAGFELIQGSSETCIFLRQGGQSSGLTAPSGPAQGALIRCAFEKHEALESLFSAYDGTCERTCVCPALPQGKALASCLLRRWVYDKNDISNTCIDVRWPQLS